MTTYYYGTATFRFIPELASGLGPTKLVSGSCQTHHRATSEQAAIAICRQSATSKAGNDYRYESLASTDIQSKEFDI